MAAPLRETNAIDALDDVLSVYQDCQIGFALIYGWSSDISIGLEVAGAIDNILKNEFSAQFGNAATETLGNLRDPVGQVDLDLYFYRGCDAVTSG